MLSAGGNLKRLLFNRQQASEVQSQGIDGLHSWIESIRTFPKPVIAAVEGAAAGAGFSLALACDFLVAARNGGLMHGVLRRAPGAAGSSASPSFRRARRHRNLP